MLPNTYSTICGNRSREAFYCQMTSHNFFIAAHEDKIIFLLCISHCIHLMLQPSARAISLSSLSKLVIILPIVIVSMMHLFLFCQASHRVGWSSWLSTLSGLPPTAIKPLSQKLIWFTHWQIWRDKNGSPEEESSNAKVRQRVWLKKNK